MFQLRVLERHCTDAEQARRIAESRNVVIEALHDLESLLLTLYPPALEEQGLGPALEVYVQEFSRTAQIHIETDLEILPERLCSTVEIGLFRVAQDALEAICQHPMISWVQLLLRLRVGAIALIIQDDGPGFTLDELSGWNFVRMRRRAESLGADCSFSTSPEGSRIEIVVPLEFKASDSDKDLDR